MLRRGIGAMGRRGAAAMKGELAVQLMTEGWGERLLPSMERWAHAQESVHRGRVLLLLLLGSLAEHLGLEVRGAYHCPLRRHLRLFLRSWRLHGFMGPHGRPLHGRWWL